MRHGIEHDVGKGTLSERAPAEAAPSARVAGKRTLTEGLTSAARGGLAAASQPFPHLDALRPYLGAAQHAVLARTPAAIGGPAQAAAGAMGHAMGGEVRGWALDDKAAFPGPPSVAEAMHEGAHVLGADEAGAHHAAELVSQGRRVEHLFGVPGGAGGAASAAPQFLVLQESEALEIGLSWRNQGLAARTIEAVLQQNLKEPARWPTRTSLEDHLGSLLVRAQHIKAWASKTERLTGHEVEVAELVDSDGKRNQGIFLIMDATDGQQYIVKAVNPGAMSEFNSLKKLNSDAVTQPEQGPDHPSFPTLVEAGPSVSPPDSFKRDNPQLGMMTAAPGKSLLAMHDECMLRPELAVKLCEIYELVGRNISSFNFKHSNGKSNVKQLRVYTHNDLNPSNIFFDDKTNRVTLIDHDSVGLHELMYVDRDVSDLLTLVAQPVAARAGARRTLVGVEQDEVAEEDQLRTEFRIFNAFVRGYLAKMPELPSAREVVVKGFAELRAKILNQYVASAKPTPPQETLIKRFPDAYAPLA
jgi:hypothetical protein